MGKYLLIAACLVLIATTAVVSGGRSDDPIGVAVSPQMLLLGSDQGGSVVVHTDGLAYSSVDPSSVTLNGIAATATKADLCGDLVAYFDEAAVKAIVAPPSATLTLSGSKLDGTTFSGSDTVKVAEK